MTDETIYPESTTTGMAGVAEVLARVKYGRCVTHHECECRQARREAAERIAVAAIKYVTEPDGSADLVDLWEELRAIVAADTRFPPAK